LGFEKIPTPADEPLVNLGEQSVVPGGIRCRNRNRTAFSLMEVMFSVVIVGVLVIALYSALASAIPMVRSCQENEIVTQILSEKLDTIRLYNWKQLSQAGKFIPTNFIIGIDPLKTNSTSYYTGNISIVEAPIGENYAKNLLQVTVKVDWVSGKRPQSQSMVTYVAEYGLQTYIMR
jgi:hypothetical protein